MLATKAYAKINLGLNVINKDEVDGYHNLDMVMLPLELHDRIEIELLPNGFDTLITCDECDLPMDENNIVNKVERLLKEKTGYKQTFRIHIHKIIPIGAGLGGGSADGASVLLALNKVLKLKLSIDELCALGAQVGSDIPFCIRQNAARIKEKGNLISLIKQKKKLYVLILFPKKGLSTKEVYNMYDEVGSSTVSNIDGIVQALEKNDIELLYESMGNQLYDAAIKLYPNLEKIRLEMEKEGLPKVMMTGSGSSLFCISHDLKLLKKVSINLINKGYKVIVTETK